MDPITISTLATVAASAASIGKAYETHEASEASRRAERIRQRQMQLDNMRRRREAIRQALVAQGVANARGVAQGVGEGSSVLFGASAQIGGELGRNTSYIDASGRNSDALFGANADIASARGMSALFGQVGDAATGVVKNSDQISAVGQQLFGSDTSNPWRTTITYGG